MKGNIIAAFAALAIIGGVLYIALKPAVASTANVSVENGTQIVEIAAKGKYTPSLTTAKAGMPTTLRVKTTGTFDCTSILRVPSIGYQQTLPLSGATDIQLPAQQAGASVQGVCSMGMYSFKVVFN